MMSPDPLPNCQRDARASELERRVEMVLARAYELAAADLQGINEAALELADAAGDDGRVMQRAYRVVAHRVSENPSHANKQVGSLVRRAIELGMWRWQWSDTKPVP